MIVFDLDGTLADCEHRRHFVDPLHPINHNCDDLGCIERIGGKIEHIKNNFRPDWQAFYEACNQDHPIKPVFDILDNLWRNEVYFEIWSGRCESVREKTIHFLCKYSPGYKLLHTYNESDSLLKMRPLDNYTPDDELKERWLDEALASGKNIDFVFDDSEECCTMWRRRGIFVFNCCQHDKEF